jgi:hypothetical protein
MSRELEKRLERVGAALPEPTADSRDRARNAALAALPQEPRRRGRRALLLLLPAAVAVVVAAVAVLAAPWRESPLAADRALAALGDRPVVHAIVEQPRPLETVVDLKGGEERQVEGLRTEYWHDDERNALRVRISVGDTPIPGGGFLHTPEGIFTDTDVWGAGAGPRLDQGLEGFATGYREALANGDATVVGEEMIDGREAVILRFSLPPSPWGGERTEEVAVDKETYRPLRLRGHFAAPPGGVPSGRILSWSQALRIVEIETIPRDPGDFQRPKAGEPRPRRHTGVEERTLVPDEAGTVLGRPVFWPGRPIGGVELTKIELIRVTTEWTDGRVTHGRSLVFQYGADRRTASTEGKRSLLMTLGTSTWENPRYGVGWSPPRPGELRLSGFRSPAWRRGPDQVGNKLESAESWFGSMQRDGVYISFESRERELIVAAAKSLVPLG